MTIKYRFDAYVLHGKKFMPILARKEVVDEITDNLKKQGFVVNRAGCKAFDRLKYRKWVYY